MLLEDAEASLKWMETMPDSDKSIAKYILQTLSLVSHDDFFSSIFKIIDEISNNSSSNRVAVIPLLKDIAKVNIHQSNDVDGIPKKERREHFSSGHMLGYFLENLERMNNKKFQVQPTIAQLRAEKIKQILIVDDIIGSGESVEKFYKHFLHKSIKSWVSYKKCHIWVVAYAAHPQGIRHILNAIPCFSETIRFHIKLPVEPSLWDDPNIMDFFRRYGERSHRPNASLGYHGIMTSMIFQHSCPNTTPSCLWGAYKSYKPPFRERSVSPALYKYFKSGTIRSYSEILWSKRQFQLALSLLEKEEAIKTKLLVMVLGLISSRVRLESIKELLLISESDFTRLLEIGKKFGLLNDSCELTSFGRDFLHRNKINPKENVKFVDQCVKMYYPVQLGGASRTPRED